MVLSMQAQLRDLEAFPRPVRRDVVHLGLSFCTYCWILCKSLVHATHIMQAPLTCYNSMQCSGIHARSLLATRSDQVGPDARIRSSVKLITCMHPTSIAPFPSRQHPLSTVRYPLSAAQSIHPLISGLIDFFLLFATVHYLWCIPPHQTYMMSPNCPAPSARRDDYALMNVTELIHERFQGSPKEDWERLALCWGYSDCGDCHRSEGFCGWCAVVGSNSLVKSPHSVFCDASRACVG